MTSTNAAVNIPSDEVSPSYGCVAKWDIVLPAFKLEKKMLVLLEAYDLRDGPRYWMKVTGVDSKSVIGSIVVTGEKFNGEIIKQIARINTRYIVRRKSIPRKE